MSSRFFIRLLFYVKRCFVARAKGVAHRASIPCRERRSSVSLARGAGIMGNNGSVRVVYITTSM